MPEDPKHSLPPAMPIAAASGSVLPDDRYAVHARHYVARSLIQIDRLISMASDLREKALKGVLEEDFAAIQWDEFEEELIAARNSNIEGLCAAFGKSHTIPVLKR